MYLNPFYHEPDDSDLFEFDNGDNPEPLPENYHECECSCRCDAATSNEICNECLCGNHCNDCNGLMIDEKDYKESNTAPDGLW